MWGNLSLPLDDAGRTVGGLNLYADRRGRSAPGRGGLPPRSPGRRRCCCVSCGGAHIDRAVHARQLEMAVGMQGSLLPTLPRLAGISSAARYLAGGPYAQVGGDWYDLFALPDGAIGVAVGDAMGHDVAAAAAMGPLRRCCGPTPTRAAALRRCSTASTASCRPSTWPSWPPPSTAG
jgi:hypothetical protein